MAQSLFGVTPHQPSMTDAQMVQLAASGADTVRVTANFLTADYSGEVWPTMDSRVLTAASRRIKCIISLTMPGDITQAQYGPRVTAIVNRYKPSSSWWQDNGVAPVLVEYIAGNEPNIEYSPFTDDRAKYAGLADRAATAALNADPSTNVYVGGMSPTGGTGLSYLADTLRLLNKTHFAGCCYHPYATDAEGALNMVHQVRRVIRQLGWGNKRLLIDEVAWNRGKVGGLENQAHYLGRFFWEMARRRNHWNIYRVLWYGFIDADAPIGSALDVMAGLFLVDGSPTPAWRTFAKFAERA